MSTERVSRAAAPSRKHDLLATRFCAPDAIDDLFLTCLHLHLAVLIITCAVCGLLIHQSGDIMWTPFSFALFMVFKPHTQFGVFKGSLK